MKHYLKQLVLFFFNLAILCTISIVAADTESDTNTLLNWAENNYPQYFSSHQTTQSMTSWLYRYYPDTNVYAGVNTNDNGVYVLGGPWGDINPTYIDSLSNLLAISQNGKLTDVASLLIQEIGLISSTSYALKKDGTVWGWGANGTGSVGDGTTEDRGTPVKVVNLNNVVDVVSLSGSVTAALKSDGTVWAWGWNNKGDIGNGNFSLYEFQTAPVQIVGLDNVIKLGSTPIGMYAIKEDGTLWLWGCSANLIINGSLLCPILESPLPPAQITTITDVKEFRVMSYSGIVNTYYVIKNNGTLWAWGNNLSGQLGDGTTSDRDVPAQIEELTDVVSLEFGNVSSSVFALQGNGTVWAWGSNSSLGISETLSTESSILKPTQVKNLVDITKISINIFHGLALKKDGTVWVWGSSNIYGQLGNGKISDPMIPRACGQLNCI